MTQLGQDIVDHGDVVASSSTRPDSTFPTTESNGCQPPRKKRAYSAQKLLEKRIQNAEDEKSTMKVSSHQAVNERNHVYTLMSSSRARNESKVVISNQPSCSCADYSKNGKQAHCKHILFVLMYGHGVTDTSLFKNMQFTDQHLTKFFATPVSELVIKSKEPAKRSSSAKAKREEILKGHPNYNDVQTYEVHHKASKSAKCHGFGCKSVCSYVYTYKARPISRVV